MIYQCYYKKDQEGSLFKEEPYTGFGLEPEVNENLFENCPELEDPFVRLQLTEYACFLWHWRNQNDQNWFGTTSHRQLEKFPLKFFTNQQVTDLVKDHGVVGWGQYDLYDAKGGPITLAKSTEVCHPGLNDYMDAVLKGFGHETPDEWKTACSGFFANYWVMRKDLFNDFMEFSWPMVEWSLRNIKKSSYYRMQHQYGTVSNAKATGYFMERLFLIWYMKNGIKPFNPTTSQDLFHRV